MLTVPKLKCLFCRDVSPAHSCPLGLRGSASSPADVRRKFCIQSRAYCEKQRKIAGFRSVPGQADPRPWSYARGFAVQRLYRELDAKKLKKFRPPACYLTNEGGCPCGEPIIGIPFYLASVELSQLEKDTNDLEDAREVMMDYGTKRDTTPPCCRACRRS